MAKKNRISKTESEANLRKNFYSFQKKVGHLEEIRHELSSLESKGLTKGFEKEVNLIRSRLKDTTAVPILVKRMNKLRSDIRNKRIVKKKSPINKIESHVSKLDSSLADTGKKLENKVARIDTHLEDSQQELKKEIKNLKLHLDESLTKKQAIDSRVGFVVDDGFQDFLKEVKMDLSERVKAKESQLNDQLRKDLDLRRRELEAHYKTMEEKLTTDIEDKEKRLKQSYQLRLENGLKKEIYERFNAELRKKFDAERDKLDAFYVDQLKKKYHAEYLKQKKFLEERFRVKVQKEIDALENEHKINESNFKLRIQKKLNKIDVRKKSLENKLMKEFSAIGFEKEQQREILKNKLKLLESELEKNKAILKDNLGKLEKQKNIDIAKVKKNSNQYGKELAKEHHDRLEKEISEYRRKINEKLKKEFVERMNHFVNAQKTERDRIIRERLLRLNKQLEHQKKINELLKENVSQKDLQLEQMKQKNNEMVNREISIKNEEVKKYQVAQNALIQKHKADIQKLTNNLEWEFKTKFNHELRNRVKQERESLDRDYERKKTEIANKMRTASFLQRAVYRQNLKKKYNRMYQRNVNSIQRKLKEQLRNEFKSQAEKALNDERKKLSIKLSELESEKSRLAVEMQHKLSLKLNKVLTDEKIKHDADIISRTKQLNVALESQRKINDLLRGKLSEEDLAMKKLHEDARKEVMKRKIELEHKAAKEGEIAERKKEELNLAFERKKAEMHALLEKKEVELAKTRQTHEEEIERSKAKSRELLEQQRQENVKLIAMLTKTRHEGELHRQQQKRRLLEQHKKELQALTDNLKTEYNKKFESEIKKHINDENVRLREMMKSDLDNAKARLKVVSRKDSREYKRKLAAYYNYKLNQSVEKEKKRLREALHKEFYQESKKSFDSEKKKLQNRLKEYENKYKAEQESLKIKEKNLIEANRARNLELAAEKESFADKLNLLKKQEDLIIKKERVRIQKEITEKEHQKMLDVLKKREALLKARYQKEFGDKLKAEHANQEAELSKKKAELAEELRKKASTLFS